MTIDEARKLLGDESLKLSDVEVEKLIEELNQLALIVIDAFKLDKAN